MTLPLSINSFLTIWGKIMIKPREIFEIHRMANEGLSVTNIARLLHLSRKTVRKYLKDPNFDGLVKSQR